MKYKITDEVFYTIPRVVALVKKYSSGQALDVGCGTGAYFKYFSGKEIYGIDTYDKYFKLIDKKKFPRKKIILKKGDMRKIPFRSESFDFVLCVLVLEYMKTEKEFKKALSELKRVLAKDGILIIVTPHRNSLTTFIRTQIISRLLPNERKDINFVMGVPRTINDLQSNGFITNGCLGWVSYKAIGNDFIGRILDTIFWNVPFFAGSLIGIYKKS